MSTLTASDPLTSSFSIAYTEGTRGPKLRRSEFASLAEAAAYATKLGIALYLLRVTEWDESHKDGYGVPAFVGSCSLEEAYEGGYTSLLF